MRWRALWEAHVIRGHLTAQIITALITTTEAGSGACIMNSCPSLMFSPLPCLSFRWAAKCCRMSCTEASSRWMVSFMHSFLRSFIRSTSSHNCDVLICPFCALHETVHITPMMTPQDAYNSYHPVSWDLNWLQPPSHTCGSSKPLWDLREFLGGFSSQGPLCFHIHSMSLFCSASFQTSKQHPKPTLSGRTELKRAEGEMGVRRGSIRFNRM